MSRHFSLDGSGREGRTMATWKCVNNVLLRTQLLVVDIYQRLHVLNIRERRALDEQITLYRRKSIYNVFNVCVTYDKWANDRFFFSFLAMTSFKVDAATWPLPFFTFLFFFFLLFFGFWNVVWQQSRRTIIHPSMRCHWTELRGRKQGKGRDSRLMATFYFQI